MRVQAVSRFSRRYQLLIADDDAAFRETLRLLFEPCFELIEAESGEEAICIVEYRPVDIALLDMNMQQVTGLETVRFIKTVNEQAPCILVTADVSDNLLRDAEEAEAFSVLSKPVTRRDVVQTVQTAMDAAYNDPDVLAPLLN